MAVAARGSLLERLPTGVRRCILAAEPSRLSRAHYEASLGAVLLLGAVLGVQLVCTAMAAFGPLAEPPPAETLTTVGRLNVHASHDIAAYVAGCVAAFALIAVLVRVWSLALNRGDLRDPAGVARRGAALHAGLAAVSLFAYLGVVGSLRDALRESLVLPPAELARLAAPTAVSLLALVLYYAHRLRRRALPPAT